MDHNDVDDNAVIMLLKLCVFHLFANCSAHVQSCYRAAMYNSNATIKDVSDKT